MTWKYRITKPSNIVTNSETFTIQTLKYYIIKHTNCRKENLLTVFVQMREDPCASNHKIPQKKSLLVMFAGDRGLCIGSKIKGFLKYGGNWKSNKNSLYMTVCITNKHNTSQTCLFCFKKLPSGTRKKRYS